jgi:cytochrome b subunit of formate dehydrogenase
MTVNEVWQHYCLVITFVTLVITGFSLRYAEAWWTEMLFGFEGGFALRGLIHRIAGVAFIITSVWHALFLLTGRGRQFIIDMFPVKKDIIQVYEQIVYNLGITKTPPEYDRFGYVEKAEYWALVWGTLVMIVTGLILWFENTLVAYMPKTILDVTLVVHYYEAWLASLAILVWHLYSTMFSPKVYPMNPSWFKGKMPLHMYEHEHGNAPADPADIDPNGSDQARGGTSEDTNSAKQADRSQQN